MKGSRSFFARVVLGAAWVALAGGAACSRTDDPVEHFGTSMRAGSGPAPSGGTHSNGAAPGQQAGSGGTGAEAGNRAENLGGSPEGGSGPVRPTLPTELGCGDPPVSSEPFSRSTLRAAAADCAQYHYCRFESGARILDDQVGAYVEAPGPDTLALAQAAFAQAMSLWSVAELFQFGPAGSSAVSSGKDIYQGQGLRELLHPWPLTVRCRVEEQVAMQHFLDDMPGVPISGRGLFGLEYLLFYPASDTACLPTSATGKAWAKLEGDELAARKLEYAAALSSDVLAQGGAIRTAWAAGGGNFRPLFVDATGYPDEAKAMTVMAWSLLYVEREVKDWKLGVQAGYTLSSPVTLAESAYSGLGTENLRANLRGFRALFQGCGAEGQGLGFDDWLSEREHADLANDIVAAWEKAQRVADHYPPFAQATPGELDALYRAVKTLTDLLKTDLFGDGSPLGLDLPEGIASDTD